MEGQKQVCDMKAGKRMSVGQSNEHLRIGDLSAWNANRAGNLDPTRTHLNFEIGKGGVVKEVDKKTSISKRILSILTAHGIKDPNAGLTDEQLEQKRVGVRTHANFILQGSRDTMRKLAFGEQDVNYKHGADNSRVTRSPEIEKWAVDMYRFMARKYGEENIAAFVVHLDETNPHIHATVVPVTQSGKLSFVDVFAGKDKYEYSQRTKQLHDELAEVNKKWGLERGESVAVTGAKHKTYLQWLKEQIFNGEKTLEEQGSAIQQNNQIISSQKQMLYELNAEIAKANRKYKALMTMISNLETQKEAIEIDIAALEEEYEDLGNISKEEYQKKLDEYQKKLSEIEEKLSDKKTKVEETIEQIRDLGKQKHQLQNNYDDLQRKINKDLPVLEDKTVHDMMATGWMEAQEEIQSRYEQISEFQRTLTPEQQRMFSHIYDNVLDGSIIEDMAQRGNEIVAVGAALFLGYIDQATRFAEGSGGGGGDSTSEWGKKDNEDDEIFRRRCFFRARMMMKPRKIRKHSRGL
jgi:predicted  nucleic acid-binding Zn-ribbon protein